MSDMSFLEKLLDGVEVEWKTLEGVIISLKTGLNPRQNFQLNSEDAEGYYVTVREIQNGKVTFLDKTDRVNKRALELINNRANLEAGDILFSGTGTVGRTAVVEEEPLNWNVKEGVYVIKPDSSKIHSRYLSHLLNSQEIVKDYSKKIVGAPVISLPMGDLRKLQIPIPCPDNPEKSLEIQTEIVRILDTFTELTAELTAELNLRKKQYNYYRDKLLSFPCSSVGTQGEAGMHSHAGAWERGEEGEVEWKTLGEVANIKNGKDWKKLGAGDIPVYGSGGVMQHVDTFAYDKPTVLIPRKGSITNIFYLESPFWNVDTIYYTEIDTGQIIPKFFYYFMKTIDLMQLDTGSGRPSLTQAILNEIKIPLPALDEQARIVAILDKFDTLTHSISEGLPREIELRQKQYEYYRDLLLSFPKEEEPHA
ncbi:MAG: restriction endonuclease subunit S [Zetaproteobacteria bacterium CG2_30_46_52]|nr:MAG: restriction endonuclease subunit S [Zetaproteobacteria bacterium CG2_30_46_52]